MAMSHGPQLMMAPHRWHLLTAKDRREHGTAGSEGGVEGDPDEIRWSKWRRCMEAIDKLRARLHQWSPDALILVGDDQHENLLDDAMPPFTVYVGPEAEASVSLRYLNESPSTNRSRYEVPQRLGETLVEGLMEQGFDVAYSRNLRHPGGLGHAFARPLKFLASDGHIPVLPVMVNTYYPPAPSARRCVEFGRALRKALAANGEAGKVAVLASGGLSHTKIDEELDRKVIGALEAADLDSLGDIPGEVLVRGTSEIRCWMVVAALAERPARMIDYQPLYRSAGNVGCAMGFAASHRVVGHRIGSPVAALKKWGLYR